MNQPTPKNCTKGRQSKFLQHIKRTSEKVKQWPDWKKGEYATLYNYLENRKSDSKEEG